MSALALAVSPAMATELRFDGFASFVAGQVIDKDELMVNPQTGDTVAFRGYDEKLSFQPNSLFAIQARADLQENLSATAQIIAKGQDNYDAKFNWAYLAYQINSQLTVKAGRFRQSLFLYSDFLDVGYAYHWISPPDGVYNLSGFDSSDGVMLEWQTEFGGIVSTATFATARTETDVDGGIVNPSNGDTISKDDIANLYLAKTKTFPSGKSAIPLDRTEGSPARVEFVAKVIDKDEAQMKSYWSRLIFTGKGVPPKVVESDAEVKEMVARNPDTIGFIDAGTVDGTVKVVAKF